MDYAQAVKEILAKHLKMQADEISDTTHFNDFIAIDSITFASIITDLEKLAGKQIPVTEWIRLSTVSHLIDIVEKQVDCGLMDIY